MMFFVYASDSGAGSCPYPSEVAAYLDEIGIKAIEWERDEQFDLSYALVHGYEYFVWISAPLAEAAQILLRFGDSVGHWNGEFNTGICETGTHWNEPSFDEPTRHRRGVP